MWGCVNFLICLCGYSVFVFLSFVMCGGVV